MKRSREIVLVLSAVAAGTIGCRQSQPPLGLSAENVYTNNHYVPGAGYYHAPYYAWFPFPYNSYVPGRGYYYGGNYNHYPDERTEIASRPSSGAVTRAQAAHTAAVRRGGFGTSSRSTSS